MSAAVVDPFDAIVAREGAFGPSEGPLFVEYLDERQHEVNLIGSLIDTIRTVLAYADHPDTTDSRGARESIDATLQVAERMCSQVSEALDSVTIRDKFQAAESQS